LRNQKRKIGLSQNLEETMSTPENPAAFPAAPNDNWFDDNQYGQRGMTLRDWFAGMQLSGACANPRYKGEITREMINASFLFADAMLAERARAPKGGSQ
jgi:hypothetical protein